jgi:hypothetical protein
LRLACEGIGNFTLTFVAILESENDRMFHVSIN